MKQTTQLAFVSGFLIASGLAQAHEAGTFVVRAGAGQVSPKSGNLNLGSLDVGGGVSLDSASIEVDHGWSLVLSGTYMLTERWGIDILASAPFKHEIDVKAQITVGGETEAGRVNLGETYHLPPTVSIQYHLSPDTAIQPYVGLGLNWTLFFDEGLTSGAEDLGFRSLNLDDSVGVAAQLGMDMELTERWLLNADVRWINIESDVDVAFDFGDGPQSGRLGTVEIDPWVYQLNIGYRF